MWEGDHLNETESNRISVSSVWPNMSNYEASKSDGFLLFRNDDKKKFKIKK